MKALPILLILLIINSLLGQSKPESSSPESTMPTTATLPPSPSPEALLTAQEELKNNRNFQAGIRAIRNQQLGTATQLLLNCSRDKKLSTTAKQIVDITRAETYIRNHQPKQALDIYDSLPANQIPPYWKGVALCLSGKWSQALPLLYSVPAEPAETYWLAQQAIAYAALAQQDNVLLEQIHTQLLNSPIHSVTLRARISLASRYLILNKPEQAIEMLAPFLHASEEDKEAKGLLNLALLVEVKALILQKKWEQAKQLCNQILESKNMMTKTKDSATISLAETFLAEEKSLANADNTKTTSAEDNDNPDETGKGEGILLNFISSNPDSSFITQALQILLAENTFKDNALAYKKLVAWSKEKHNKRAPLALYTLALTQKSQGKIEEARGTIDNMLARYASHPATQSMILQGCNWLIKDKRFEEASQLLKKSTQKSAQSLFAAGILSYEQGNFNTAEAQFSEARLLADEFLEPTAALNAECAALMAEDFAKADQYIQEAKQDPKLHATMSYQAASLAAHYLRPDAEKRLNDFLLAYPNAPEIPLARLDLAEWCLLQNPPNTQKAAVQLSQLKENSLPKNLHLRNIQISLRLHDTMDQKNDSILTLRNAIKSFPENESLQIKLGETLYQNGQFNEALINLRHFIQLFPQSPRCAGALYLAGKAALQTHAVESLSTSIELFEQCSQIESPYQIPARIEIASILIRQGKAKEALKAIEDILPLKLSQNQRNLALTTKADAWAMLVGSDEQALQHARDIMTEILNTPNLSNMWKFQTHSRRAAFANQAGDSDAALMDYESILALDPSSLPTPKRRDWYWYYSAGFAAIHLLELKQEYARALALAEHLSRTTGERAEEAAAHAKRIRLENFIYEDDK